MIKLPLVNEMRTHFHIPTTRAAQLLRQGEALKPQRYWSLSNYKICIFNIGESYQELTIYA